MPKKTEHLSSYFTTTRTPHPAIIVLFLIAANYFRYQILFFPFTSTPVVYSALIASVGVIFLYEALEKKKKSGAPLACTQAGISFPASTISIVFTLIVQLAMMFSLLSSFLEGSLHVESFGLLLGIVVVSGFASVVGGFSWIVGLCAMAGIIIIGGTIFSAFGVGRVTAAFFNQQMTPSVQTGDTLQWIGGCVGLPLISLWMWRIDTKLLPRNSKSVAGPAVTVASLLIALSVGMNTSLLQNTGLAQAKSAGVLTVIAIAASGIAGTSWNISSLFALRLLGEKMSESKKALAGRLAAAGVVILSIAFIQVAKTIGADIVSFYIAALACFVTPVVALFVVQSFTAKSIRPPVRWSLFGGEVFAVAFFVAIRTGILHDPFLVAPVIVLVTLTLNKIAGVKYVRTNQKVISQSTDTASVKSLFIQ